MLPAAVQAAEEMEMDNGFYVREQPNGFLVVDAAGDVPEALWGRGPWDTLEEAEEVRCQFISEEGEDEELD